MMFLLHVLLALVYVNLIEWVVHKYVLHLLGAKKASMFSFHWHRHHRTCRKTGFADQDYRDPVQWQTTGKEIAGLALLALVHIPVLWLSQPAYWTLFAYAVVYYVLHAKSHRDPVWGQKWLPWHYDHHMGRSQQANFNVVVPLWDYILGYRIKYRYVDGKAIQV